MSWLGEGADIFRELADPTFLVAGVNEAQTFDWIQVHPVSDRTLIKALGNEFDIGEAEAIAFENELMCRSDRP